MSTGRGFGNYSKGPRIATITNVHTGDLLLEHSAQFDADNTILVTRELDGRVWAHFVNSEDWTERWGEDFCIWDFNLAPGPHQIQLWRAVPHTGDRNLAAFLHEILLTPYLDGPIARIEAAVTKVGIVEHDRGGSDPGDEDDREQREAAKIAEYYREYRALVSESGRTVPQYSDSATE